MENAHSRSAGLDPIVAEVIEAHAGTMVDMITTNGAGLVELRRLPLWANSKD